MSTPQQPHLLRSAILRFRMIRRVLACGLLAALLPAYAAEEPNAGSLQPLTNAAAVRDLTPQRAQQALPVRLQGVATFVFDTHSFFVQDSSAGIYVGGGQEFKPLSPGDRVVVEGVSGPGDFAPIVRPSRVEVLGHGDFPAAKRVSYEDLLTGREDSQWVEVEGLVRVATSEPGIGSILEIATGGGRLTAFIPGSNHSGADELLDSQVRLKGVCGSWFNRLRQLFGVRLMVPRPEDIIVEVPASTNVISQPAMPIGSILRFGPEASVGHRVKVVATVILQQPGALFVQDQQYGLYVQTRQAGMLAPGDIVELIGFPNRGEYTPTLQDAVWTKLGSGPEPRPTLVGPDEALAGTYDSRLVTIEGRLLDHSQNRLETVLVLESGGQLFSAHLDSTNTDLPRESWQNFSRLRVTGVCRIDVGEDWRAGPDWRAKSFRILMRSPADAQVLKLPPWWTLQRLLWAVGLLAAVVLAALGWVAMLHLKVGQQTTIIRHQLEIEERLKERYQELFESANDMVYTHDLTGRITSINAAGERLLGRKRNEINQRHLVDFLPEEQRPAAEQWLQDIVDGVAPDTVEWDFIAADGERIKLEVSTRIIEHVGRQVEVEGIARDVSDRRRLEKEILDVSAREQRRIGHDLHDGVCQQLAGIGFLADVLADKLDEHKRPEAAEVRQISELVNQANKQTRGVARGLFPVRLEENGLVSALEELVQNAARFFSRQCEFNCDAPVAIQDAGVAQHLYYIAQEAILNAVNHGEAHRIEVRLAPDGEHGCILSVRDDGKGFASPVGQSRGMGLRIMNYRASMIGGAVQISSRPEGGTEVLCRFTCESQHPADAPVAVAESPVDAA